MYIITSTYIIICTEVFILNNAIKIQCVLEYNPVVGNYKYRGCSLSSNPGGCGAPPAISPNYPALIPPRGIGKEYFYYSVKQLTYFELSLRLSIMLLFNIFMYCLLIRRLLHHCVL